MSIMRCGHCDSPWDSDWIEHCPVCGPPPGYDVFDFDGTGIYELQRDDEDAFYANDEEAWLAFINDLGYLKDERAIACAVKLLENWMPYMTKVMRGDIAVKPPIRRRT